ncbi:MAG: hypothetical protein IJ272_10250 [Clostridia bacterium]|nr:hypothetical protein [Clostridia bacterium]
MKIYLVESTSNKELYNYLKQKHIIVTKSNLNEASVVIVNKVHNIREALDIVDFALNQGKEVICIKNNFAKEHYVCNYLIQNGASYV